MSAKPKKLEVLSEDDNSSQSEKQSDAEEPESPQEKKPLKDKKKPPAVETKNANIRRDETPTPDTAKV